MMSSISLVTTASRRDVELCALQCESVDRYLSCYVKHHLIVPDDEVALFDRFNAPRRVVVAALLVVAAHKATQRLSSTTHSQDCSRTRISGKPSLHPRFRYRVLQAI
jgi:hypothetical protein